MEKHKMQKQAARHKPSGFASSRRAFSTVVTIFSLLFLILTFIVFMLLFKVSAGDKESIEGKFSSLEAEFVLKNFLRSPAPDTRQTPVNDLTPEISVKANNADLISWTCNAGKNDANYKALKESVNTFFDNIYQKDWELRIIYSNQDADERSFGHKSWLRDIFRTISGQIAGVLATHQGQAGTSIYFTAHSYKEKGLGIQVIPCQDGSFALVVLKARDYVNFKDIGEDKGGQTDYVLDPSYPTSIQ